MVDKINNNSNCSIGGLIVAVCLLYLINCCVTLSYITDKKSIKYNLVLLSNIIDHKSYFNCYQTFTGCLISHHRIIVTKVFNNINSSPKKCQIFWIKSRLKMIESIFTSTTEPVAIIG